MSPFREITHRGKRGRYHLGYHISASRDIWYRMQPIINELEAYSLTKAGGTLSAAMNSLGEQDY